MMPHPVISEVEKYDYQQVGRRSEKYPFKPELSKEGQIEYFNNGQENSFQRVGKAISLNGGSTGAGPAVIVRDVLSKDSPVNMFHTGGLTGCQAIAMTGINRETGKVDAFFAHSRDWQNPPSSDDKTHPIILAKQFIKEHDAVRVQAGTDFGAHRGSAEEGKHFANETRRKLSSTLGVWIREHDVTQQKDATFLPGMGMMYSGTPKEAVDEYDKDAHIDSKINYSKAKQISPSNYQPKPALFDKIVALKKKKWARSHFLIKKGMHIKYAC